MKILLKYLILAHYKNENDIDGVPCVVCLRLTESTPPQVRVYIDEDSEAFLRSQEGTREWSEDFFEALRQLHELDLRRQDEQFSALEQLCVGPIRTVRSGVAKMPGPSDDALEFQSALKLLQFDVRSG